MRQYLYLLRKLLVEGDRQFNKRTGYLMIGKAGHQSVYDLRNGFPATTTKPLFFRGVVEELCWFARGERNVRPLIDRGIHIWDRNAYQHYLRRHKLQDTIRKNTDEWDSGCREFISRITNDHEFARVEGDLGPIYGFQWRHWKDSDRGETDQLANVFRTLREDPGSRYAVLTAWKPDDLKKVALPPCHVWAQFSVFENRFLDIHLFQRSCDVFLGVPFNIATYSLLGTLVGRELGLETREFYHTYGNVHIYAGVPQRSNFLTDNDNFAEFRKRVDTAKKLEDYRAVLEWYEDHAPPEGEIHRRKDHIPFILKQLSYEPKALPTLEIITSKPFFELINQSASEVVQLKDYSPWVWDSKAIMAA